MSRKVKEPWWWLTSTLVSRHVMRLFPVILVLVTTSMSVAQPVPLSPTAVSATADGATLYVACATADRILRFDTASLTVTGSIIVPEAPLGLALSTDAKRLYVTCAAAKSGVCVIDLAKLAIVESVSAGHTAMAPVVSPDGKTLYVCNRFDNDVSVFDLPTKKEVCRIPVQREPVAAAITKDGEFLLVANFLPTGRADVNYVAASISVIATTTNKVIKELLLPSGSGSLNDIRISPDGKYAVVTHLVGRFTRLPTHVAEGWINANALTVIDVAELKIHGTMLLDDHYTGAANPWGAAWSSDGANLAVTHAGTHEVSVIDFQKLLAQLPAMPPGYDAAKTADLYEASKAKNELPDDLPFFDGSRARIKLPGGDLGPRGVAVVGQTAYVANYFSDTLTVIDLIEAEPAAKSIALGPRPVMDAVRKGEFYFHDAGICYDGWQSCASCHPGDGRVDGLNWDLLNDGVGNPKNTKNLLLATARAPVMSLGVRANAGVAVRAGVRYILFTNQSEEVISSLVAYIQSLKPVPSPLLVHGRLSSSATRGKKIFALAHCVDCHLPSSSYTDMYPYDVGTRGPNDKTTDKFYTSTLIEVWRTAPYLHDGSAPTIRDVVTARNPKDEHGDTSKLTSQEIDDLCAYVLSL
jgi:YVTN family beta-propeller protein